MSHRNRSIFPEVEDEEEASESEEEDSDSDGEEDDEPQLKYERLSSDLRQLLSDDAASCLCAHSKLLALGTHWGRVHALDAMGNSLDGGEGQQQQQQQRQRKGTAHSVAVRIVL